MDISQEIVWTPEIIYCFTLIVSSLTSIGIELISDRVLTSKLVLGTALVYGFVGAAFGTIIGIHLGGKNAQYWSIGAGTLVGARAIKIKETGEMFKRIFSVIAGNGGGKNDKEKD